MNARVIKFDLIGSKVELIPVASIVEAPYLPRKTYPSGSLKELGESLAGGMLQAIVVHRMEGGQHGLMIGSRRLHAARAKNAVQIPAVVTDEMTPLQIVMFALAENVHREDLDPFEEASSYLMLMREYDVSVETLARDLKKSEVYIRDRIKLVSLPPEVQEYVVQRKLAIRAAASLVKYSSEDQVRYAEYAVKNNLTERELGSYIRRERDAPQGGSKVYGLTVGKATAKMELFARWSQDLPAKLPVKKMNAKERTSLLEAIRETISALTIVQQHVRAYQLAPTTDRETELREDAPRNAGQVWPAGDINRIMARDRPSDEVLAKDLGRTIGAIREMRAQVRSKRKSR